MFDDASRDVDRFGLLLVVTVVSIVMLALVNLDGLDGGLAPQIWVIVTTVLVSSTLLLALRASGISQRWFRISAILVVIIVVANVINAILQAAGVATISNSIRGAPPATLVILAALAPVAVVHRLLQHRQVRTSTLLGAIAAYLLIPVAYFYAFEAVDFYGAVPFLGTAESTTTIMYFSLSTVTTLGYGDYGAASDFGRLLATSEALVGQIYLVTFVAMIVGLLAQGRSQRSDDADRDVT